MTITKTGGIKPMKQDKMKAYWEFDGKRYAIHAIRNSKSAAESIADSLRKRGFLARILQYSEGVNIWGVYARR
jgi:hypothetical protein